MFYFQIFYPNNTTAIVTPCVASEHERVINLLMLIQQRDIEDPYTLDLMAKLAAMLPRCDVKEKGFKLYCTNKRKKEYLSKDTLKAIFYGDDENLALIAQIHQQRKYEPKPNQKDVLPLKLSENTIANLLSQLIVISRETGCNTTDLMHQYSLRDIDETIGDFAERIRPYEDREEEKLDEMWKADHEAKMTSPEYLFMLNRESNRDKPMEVYVKQDSL